MSTESQPTVRVELDPRSTNALVTGVAGFLAGLLSGLGFWYLAETTIVLGTTLELGAPQVTAIWGAHLLFSTLFGVLLGILMDSRPLWRYTQGFLAPVFGLVYGALLWVATLFVVEPLWDMAVQRIAVRYLSSSALSASTLPVSEQMALSAYLAYAMALVVLANVLS